MHYYRRREPTKSDDSVGHLNTILARGGGNLNDRIFKSSEYPGFARGGMLKFRFHRRIIKKKVCIALQFATVHALTVFFFFKVEFIKYLVRVQRFTEGTRYAIYFRVFGTHLSRETVRNTIKNSWTRESLTGVYYLQIVA